MKKLIQTSLLALLTFVSANVYAYDETFALKVKSNAQKSIMFYISEPLDVQFSIYGDDEIIYKQDIHAVEPIAKTYNLNAFPDGNYQLKLETDSKITEYKIKIQDGKTVVEEPTITEKFKPVLTKQNGIVTLNMGNTDKGEVEIRIVNEYNDQLYSKSFDSAKLNKKFNISGTNAKELTFIVKFKNQEFIKTVSVN
jgi:hypothetical protein